MEPLSLLGLIIFLSGVSASSILLTLGYNGVRKMKLIAAGWIIVGSLSIWITLLLVYLCITSGFGIIFLIFVLPLIILVGQVVTLSLGIYYLIKGNRVAGIVLLLVHAVVLATVITLLLMFMTGAIPIRLM